MTLDDISLEALTSSPTRLRAMAAAVSLVVAGQRPSVSRVAELAGITRQALYKNHAPVCEYISNMRVGWQPPSESPTGKLEARLAKATAKLSKERRRRVLAESRLARALHHLELSDATVQALSEPGTNATPFRRPAKPR